MTSHDPHYDVIIVGSGAAGAWAAHQLASEGLSVLILEAGPLYANRGDVWAAKPHPRERQLVQQRCVAYNDVSSVLFADDVDNPYEVPEDRPFVWFRGRQLGGRMRLWGRGVLRLSDTELTAASRDGYGIDWPLRYEELAPHYAAAEQALRVTGGQEGLSLAPDSVVIGPGGSLTPSEVELAAKIRHRWPQRTAIMRRVATGNVHSILSHALATGNVTVRPDAVASHLAMTPNGNSATGVVYLDANSRREHLARGRAVVLCASTLESTRILLHTRELTNRSALSDSEHLGKHLMDHVMVEGLSGGAPTIDGSSAIDDSHPVGFLLPGWTCEAESDRPFVRGYLIGAGVGRTIGANQAGNPSDALRFLMYAYCEALPNAKNQVSLSTTKRDRWGIPALHIDMSFCENDMAMAAHAHARLREIANMAGYTVETDRAALSPGSAAHEIGTARMGSNRSDSVLDPFNRLWGLPNVLVTDGAAFPSGGYQFPVINIMAVTGRAVAELARGFSRRDL